MTSKKLLIILLSVCILFSTVFVGEVSADTTGVCFLALNDTLLELTTTPYFYGGYTYVPYTVFSSLNIYSAYVPDISAITLYDGTKHIYFETTTGATYDGDGNTYEYSARLQNGVVNVPANEVCTFFGLSYSYIAGSGSGDVVRLKNSSASYSNSTFMENAASLMQQRCNAFLQEAGNATLYDPTPTPSQNTPNPSPATPPPATGLPQDEADDRSDTSVYLSFLGLPESNVLDVLEQYKIKSCFFLTEKDILSDPGQVRAAAAKGHLLGAYLGDDPEEDFAAISQLIFEVCRVSPILVTAAPENLAVCEEFSVNRGTKSFEYNVSSISFSENASSQLYPLISEITQRADVLIECNDDTSNELDDLIKNLNALKFSIRHLRENDLKSQEADSQ